MNGRRERALNALKIMAERLRHITVESGARVSVTDYLTAVCAMRIVGHTSCRSCPQGCGIETRPLRAGRNRVRGRPLPLRIWIESWRGENGDQHL